MENIRKSISTVSESTEKDEHIEEVKKGIELLLKKYKVSVKWVEDKDMIYTSNTGLYWKGGPVQFEIYKDSGNVGLGHVGNSKGGYGFGHCSYDAKTLASKFESWLGISQVLNFDGLK